MEVGSSGIYVPWKQPTASDESGIATLLYQTHKPGDVFGLGTTTVSIVFADKSNNLAVCSFEVNITSGKYSKCRIIA